MANSPLGVYWSVEHRRQEDYTYFKALQPAAHLIMDGGMPDYTFVRDNQPNTTILARDWALSEQHSDMLRDPVGTGNRHAHEWNDHQAKLGFDRAKTLILGINEPQVWQPGVPEALRKYTIALCESATALGLRVGAMQLGVGWPGNNGPDTPPDWSPFDGVEAAIKRNGGALICHEYWADKGPSENWGWWAGRTLKCPWQVPIIIGECGVDMFVKDTSVGQQNRGWVGHMPPERYANELWEYTNRMGADPRFVGCCVFASDFQNREWFSFDVKPAYNAILSGVHDLAVTPPTVHLPAIDNGPSEPQLPPYVAAPHEMLPAPKHGVVTANVLNVRSGPNAAYPVLSMLQQGQSVVVNAQRDVWLQIAPGQWVHGGWVRLGDDLPTSTPQDNWTRILDFLHKWEGGFQDADWDAGNWTGCKVGVGVKKGTNFGISACGYPNLDIRNLTQGQADNLFYQDMYLALGIDKQSWPLCLLMMNAAVNFPSSNAPAWLQQSGGDPLKFYALMLRGYRHSPAWAQAGDAWVDRMIDLVLEASKP